MADASLVWVDEHRTLCLVAAAGVVVMVGTRLVPQLGDVLKYFTVFPCVTAWLSLERRWFPGRLAGFPVTIKGVLNDPNAVVKIIREASEFGRQLVGSNAKAVGATAGKELAAEPKKSHSAAVITLKFDDGRSAAVFFKTPSARIVPTSSVALGVTYLAMPREVGVCQEMIAEREHERRGERFDGVSFKAVFAPRPLFAVSTRLTGRDLLAWEAVDHAKYGVYPDGPGITPQQALLMTTMLARFHAANWTKVQAHRRDGRLAPFVYPRDDLSFLSIVDMIKAKVPVKWMGPIWDGCGRYVRAQVTQGSINIVLSHNDFRPGNMMFDKQYVEESRNVPLTDTQWFAKNMKREHLCVLDWEGFAFSPQFWDVVYQQLAGLSVEDRRAHAPTLLKAYLAELRAQGVPASEIPSYDDAVKHCQVMWLLLPCYVEALAAVGGVGEQWGNTATDMNAWAQRLAAGVLDATSDVDGIAARLGVESSVVHALRDFEQRVVRGEVYKSVY